MNIWIMTGVAIAITAWTIGVLIVKLISRNREIECRVQNELMNNRRIVSLEAVNASMDEKHKRFQAYAIRARLDLEEELAKALRTIIAYKGVVTKMKSTIKAKEWPAASEITKGE